MNDHKKTFCDFIIDCQFIEEQLRKGILLSAISIKLALLKQGGKSLNRISYEISPKELENLSLGELINRFGRFKPDATLTENLKRLSEMRNEIVHKEFLLLVRNKGVTGYQDRRGLTLHRASSFSNKCFEDLSNFLEGLA